LIVEALRPRIYGMKSPIKLALFASIPIEALNYRFLMPPIEVGLPANTPWHIKLLAGQWVILHLPAFFAYRWLNPFSDRMFDLELLVSGYLDTALLLLALIFAAKWIRHLARKYSPTPI
jgi:hypothetical protein